MHLTTYTIHAKIKKALNIVLASDLHDKHADASLSQIDRIRPDFILCPGDMSEDTQSEFIAEKNGFLFMRKAAEIAPLYYSLGNHELGMSEDNAELLRQSNIHLLDDSFVTLDGKFHIGGLTSGYVRSIRHTEKYAPMKPNTDFIKQFAAQNGFKLLLCHHPEYYPAFLQDTDIDLIVSGHAHGGQWRLFGKGVVAPGQGLFPKYCRGVHDNRLAISCGMANTVIFPRFFNPRELVLLNLIPKEEA